MPRPRSAVRCAAHTSARVSSRWILRFFVGLQGTDELYYLMDLRVGEGRTERGHAPGHAVLDSVDHEFVRALRVHQLRALAGMAPVVLVAEPADAAERVLDVEGFALALLLTRRAAFVCRRSRSRLAFRLGLFGRC